MMQKVPVVTIQVLKKVHATQIRVCPNGTELFHLIYERLIHDYSRPLGWVAGTMINGIPDMREAWLVEYQSNLYWVEAPSNRLGPGREWMREAWIVNLPQIFI